MNKKFKPSWWKYRWQLRYFRRFFWLIKNLYTKLISRNKKTSNRIHLIYFSCSNHFKYLCASLKSLEKINSKYIGNIYLQIDKHDYLSDKQKEEINRLNLNILIYENPKIKLYGAYPLTYQLKTYRKISELIDENDYIAKVDSDVLFTSDAFFPCVLNSKKMFIGDGIPWFTYGQGGCFFIKKSLIKTIPQNNIEMYIQNKLSKIINRPLNMVEESVSEVGDEVLTFELIKTITNKIWLTRFMLFPYQLKRMNKIENKKIRKFTAIHFERAKNDMLKFYKKVIK